MTSSTTSGPRRGQTKRWLFDTSIASLGIEVDRSRLRFPRGPVRDDTSGTDIANLRTLVAKLSDLLPLAAVHAMRHEWLAERL